MTKLSVLSLAVLIVVGLFLGKSELKAQKIDGWFLAGNKPNSYKIGLDKSVHKTGSSSAFLESTEKEITGFGTLMQTCLADEYLGKRIKRLLMLNPRMCPIGLVCGCESTRKNKENP